MNAAGYAKVLEVDVVLPSPGEQAVVEEIAVAQMTEAFVHAHVEPDAGTGTRVVKDRIGARRVDETAERRKDAGAGRVLRADAGEDIAAVPPHAGGEYTELAENLRVIEADGEGDETAKRTAGETGVLGSGEGAEGAVDQWLEFVDEEAGVEGALAATVAPVAAGGVFLHAVVSGVVDADQDQGLDEIFAGETVGCGVGAPGMAGNVGGAWVDQVLAVVQVEDGKAAVGLRAVARRKPDADVAVLGKIARLEPANAAEAGIAVKIVAVIVWEVAAPLTAGIHFGLRAVERQMLRGDGRRGHAGGGLSVVCRQERLLVPGGQMSVEFGTRRKGSGYQRWDA